MPDLPQLTKLVTVTNAVCTGPTTVYTEEDVTENMLCGKEQERNLFVGDEGAPLLIPEGGGRYYSQVRRASLRRVAKKLVPQVGLHSWNLGWGREEAPLVFTRVTALLPWIKDMVFGDLCTPF